MNSIRDYLIESAPSNPNSIVIKNKFYPSGLTEKQIYNYYIQNKQKIVKWINGRYVAFFLKLEDGTVVVKRKHSGSLINLTLENFDTIITGRTNSIYVEHSNPTNYFVVDIDAGEGVSYKSITKASELATDLLTSLTKDWERLYSSPHGMHLIGHLKKTMDLDELRRLVEIKLHNQSEYLVNVKGRKPNTINYDLSPNYNRSIHMCRYSLTKEGLICDDITDKIGKKIK